MRNATAKEYADVIQTVMNDLAKGLENFERLQKVLKTRSVSDDTKDLLLAFMATSNLLGKTYQDQIDAINRMIEADMARGFSTLDEMLLKASLNVLYTQHQRWMSEHQKAKSLATQFMH